VVGSYAVKRLFQIAVTTSTIWYGWHP